jgi:hypothetical protein
VAGGGGEVGADRAEFLGAGPGLAFRSAWLAAGPAAHRLRGRLRRPVRDGGLLELREFAFTWAARSTTCDCSAVTSSRSAASAASRSASSSRSRAFAARSPASPLSGTPGISGTDERCHGSARPADRRASKGDAADEKGACRFPFSCVPAGACEQERTGQSRDRPQGRPGFPVPLLRLLEPGFPTRSRHRTDSWHCSLR